MIDEILDCVEAFQANWTSPQTAQIVARGYKNEQLIGRGQAKNYFKNVLNNCLAVNYVLSHNYISQSEDVVVNGIAKDIERTNSEYSIKVISWLQAVGNGGYNIPSRYRVEKYLGVDNAFTEQRLVEIRTLHNEFQAYEELSFESESNGTNAKLFFFVSGPHN